MTPRLAAPSSTVLAVDPGREKCGLAIVSPQGTVFRALCPTSEVGLTCRYLLAQHPGAALVVGGGTGSDQVRQLLAHDCLETRCVIIEERDSTLQARRLYWVDYPPRGWQRLLPEGMRVPPRPVDDYAAVILARRYLQQLADDEQTVDL